MNTGCYGFRRLLERRLMGLPDPPRVSELDWHQHLHGCGDCRALLHSEEALEVLLASLPELRLPADLAQRVLARLRAAGDARLDELLAYDSGDDSREPFAAPPGLAARVLANLAPERAGRSLDGLLDRAGEVDVPARLGERVLAGLAPHRKPGRIVGSASGVRFRILRAPVMGLAAAALVACLALAAFWRLGTDRAGPGAGTHATVIGAAPEAAPEEELLAALDVLEHWELLADVRDPDLAAFNRFDASDEAQLEFFGAELLMDEFSSEGSGGR